MISIRYNDQLIGDVTSVIVVPEIAITEPGYIKAFTAGSGSGAKHEFHALAQMAYYQHQDDELEIETVAGNCVISSDQICETSDDGVVIFRDGDGQLNVLVHQNGNKKKLLEAANRYCTRWVRLDI